jgi:hypothetical protein
LPDPGYAVNTDEPHTFAGSLRSTADKLDASANAVRGVSYSVTTWGIVGQLFSIKARESTNGAADKLSKAAGRVRDAATG